MRAATESHGRMILQSRNADPVQYNGLIDSTNLERPRTSLKVHGQRVLNSILNAVSQRSTDLNTRSKIISIGNDNDLELGPDGRRLPKTIAVFDVPCKL